MSGAAPARPLPILRAGAPAAELRHNFNKDDETTYAFGSAAPNIRSDPAPRVVPIAMSRYLIKREIPNARALSAAEMQAVAQTSCGVLAQLGAGIQWVQSYDGGLDHLRIHRTECRTGSRACEPRRFPADRVLEVSTIIDPSTAEPHGLLA